MTPPDRRRRLAVLYLVAVAGLLVCVVLGAAATGSAVLLGLAVGVALVVAGALGTVAVRQLRAGRAAARRVTEGRTCSCCTTTHVDPVQVV